MADEFLKPTRIYTRAVKLIRRNYRVKQIIHGIAHITGGGLIDNPPRVLPEGCAIRLVRGSWTIPPVFPWLQALGSVPEAEMFRVFNMGIGLVLIVSRVLRRVDHASSQSQGEGSRLDHRRGHRGESGSRVGRSRLPGGRRSPGFEIRMPSFSQPFYSELDSV